MMSTSVHLSDEAYALLSALKGPTESFSDVVVRELGRGRRPLALMEIKDLMDPKADLETTRQERRRAQEQRDPALGTSRKGNEAWSRNLVTTSIG